MTKCGSKNCDLTNREQIQATKDMIVNPGYEISTSAYYSSPRLSSEVPDCSMPMTFDNYSSCSYSCSFCFAFFSSFISVSNLSYILFFKPSNYGF